MRKAMLAVAALVAAVALDAVPNTAQAYPVYPWCANYGGRSGASNCGFSTYQQCMAAVSGTGGMCTQNTFYGAAAGYYGGTNVGAPRQKSRRYRRYYQPY